MLQVIHKNKSKQKTFKIYIINQMVLCEIFQEERNSSINNFSKKFIEYFLILRSIEEKNITINSISTLLQIYILCEY